MAVYRQIHITFWQDPFILELTPEEKYFYLYLMTNSKTTQCGIYEITRKVMCFETGYNLETVDKLLTRFVGYGKILYDETTNEVFLINWPKHNNSSSPKVKIRVEKELAEVKSKILLDGYGYSMDTDPQKEKEKEPEKEPEEKIPYTKIVDTYHAICTGLPKVVKLTSKRRGHINQRWAELKTLEEFEKVFHRVTKSDFLMGRVKDWKADFDFIISESGMAKILEGKYDNKQAPAHKIPDLN